ncbi:MAG TPA: nicotinate (nicotinamide) nucleotide adenylyltransferase [Acholeplasma sp.]|nr:nicotinate (nicotinamide) nucleotide adenylyltransferase [Acholeplasma sp.]
MKIIYGGSFNPPTIAHYKIAKYLLKKYKDSEIIFMPTSSLYHKDELATDFHRLAMLELVAKELGDRASVSDFEIKLDGYYGTTYTLAHYPGSYFLLGADNLVYMNKWINYPNIIMQNKFLIVPRDNIDIMEILENDDFMSKYQENFTILEDCPKLNVSSSEYRKTKNKKLVLPKVRKYIEENNLY